MKSALHILLGVGTRRLVRAAELPPHCKQRQIRSPVSCDLRYGRIHSRQYSIRDRYVFPVREEERLAAVQSEEQKLQEQALRGHKRRKKRLQGARNVGQGSHAAEPGFDVKCAILDQPIVPEGAKSLSIAVIGPANSGKSTWINRMCGGKISSVSRKPQTTRKSIIGIATIDKTQLVVIDTPGLVPKEFAKKYNRQIATGAWDALDSAGVVLVIVDCFKIIDQVLRELIHKLDEYMQNRSKNPSMSPIRAILFLNKYDRYEVYKSRNARMYPVIDRFRKHIPSLDRIFEKIYYGSSLTGLNFDKLKNALVEMAPLREWEYAKEVVTNQSRLEIVQEVIKEKIFRHLNQELPYGIRQESVSWIEDPVRGITKIDQKLYVPKQSQVGDAET
ncbi:GTPase Era-like isoform X2 [Schistocerca gregaria]|uniref:GTPase Era-like isoform X2 n=1 Tax=Schistocerca gregaria TaxID=7010 RepID=UPI00211E9D82|nr:GTPase Era-like isoform X2 [Schistocerca gregaria]